MTDTVISFANGDNEGNLRKEIDTIDLYGREICPNIFWPAS